VSAARTNGIHFRPVSYPSGPTARYARGSMPEKRSDPIAAAIAELERQLALENRELRRLTRARRLRRGACTLRKTGTA
jgi:hypothetical protein